MGQRKALDLYLAFFALSDCVFLEWRLLSAWFIVATWFLCGDQVFHHKSIVPKIGRFKNRVVCSTVWICISWIPRESVSRFCRPDLLGSGFGGVGERETLPPLSSGRTVWILFPPLPMLSPIINTTQTAKKFSPQRLKRFNEFNEFYASDSFFNVTNFTNLRNGLQTTVFLPVVLVGKTHLSRPSLLYFLSQVNCSKNRPFKKFNLI